MRLSLICLFKRSVNGHIFRGKDRLVKPVSKNAMETLVKEYERQEKNMLLLRHPYLTPVSINKIIIRLEFFISLAINLFISPTIPIIDKI